MTVWPCVTRGGGGDQLQLISGYDASVHCRRRASEAITRARAVTAPNRVRSEATGWSASISPRGHEWRYRTASAMNEATMQATCRPRDAGAVTGAARCASPGLTLAISKAN